MPPRGSIKPQSAKFLTREQVRLLLAGPLAFGEMRDYYLLCALYYLALRDVEAVSLRPAHFVHLSRASMMIPTAKRKRHRCGDRCGDPCPYAEKWDPRKHRVVDRIADRPLLEIGVIGGGEILADMVTWAGDRTWVFPAQRAGGRAKEGDEHLSVRSVQRIYRRWASVAELDDATTPHTLRHSALSILIDREGVPPQVVRDFARHSNISVTDTYIHSTTEAWSRVAGALDLVPPSAK